MKLDDVIRADHAQSAALFDELAPLAREDQRRSSATTLAQRLAVVLKTHALAVERVVCSALRSAGDEPAALALQAPHAHHALDVVVDKLLVLRPGAEERALLPVIARWLPADEREQLARDLVAEQRRLLPTVQRRIGG
jgi:hypothetical protein